MTNQLTTSLLPCKNLLVVDTAQNFLFKDSRLIYNNCKSGNPGINAIYLYKTITFQNNEFIDNQSTVSPLALDISYSDYFTMESLKFDNNTAPEVGDYSVISLSHPNSKQGFKLSNCKFYNNVLAISASDLLNLELNNVTVSGSQNSLYSALLFKITRSETSRVAFDTLILSNNQPLDSAVRFYSDMSNSILDLQIFNSEFMGNSYSKFLLRIDGPLSLSNTSFISDSRFNDNNLSVFSLSFQKGTLSIFNSSFERNFADFDTIVSGSYSFPAVLLIENSNFSSNLGTNIISLSSNTRSNLYTKDCYFYDNQNTTISLRQGSWFDDGSVFDSNRGGKGGAVFMNSASEAYLKNTNFLNNLGYLEGGCLSASSESYFQCENCKITNNTSLISSGAIYLQQNSVLNISNSEISKNSCKKTGSAITIINSNLPSYIYDSAIFENDAEDNSVVILIVGMIEISNTNIYENYGTQSPGLTCITSTCSINKSTFKDHTGKDGSHIVANVDSVINISESKFINGYSENIGGSIISYSSNLHIKDCEFTNSKANTGGSIACYSQSSCHIDNSLFYNNSAIDSAAAISMLNSDLFINNSNFSTYFGSAIDANKLDSLTIENSNFEHGEAFSGGGLNCIECKNITISNTKFSQLSATFGGGIALYSGNSLAKSQLYTSIINSKFEQCTSFEGGGIWSEISDLHVKDSIFKMNYAKDGSGLYSGEGKGAGIFLNCEDDCQNTVINSEFYDNKAENSGGGIQWLHDQPVLADLYFKNNTALYGNDIASFPVDLKIISEARLLSDIINAPGQLSAPIIIKVIDHYNQTVFNDNLSECQLISTNLNYTLMGNTKTQAKSGVYNFSEITFLGEPDSKVSISASSSVISSISNNVGLVNIYLRSCLLGEEQTTNSCNICQAGFYNLDPGSSCVPCPTGAVCEGRNIMFPKAGYWRPSNSTDLFFKCPNENSCLSGDINNLIGICDKGYYGNMCQICEHGYSRTSEHYCSKCPSKISNTFILITVVLVSIMIVVIITRASIKAASKSNSLVSVYFKIFLNYLQIVVLTASFNLDWPSLVLQFFYIQQQAGSMTDQLFSIDCYLGENNLKPYFTKLIFIGILPLFLGLITCIFWICYYRITKESKNIRNKFIGSLVVQLFLIHSSLVKFNFSMFDCAEILPGEYWLKSDMSVQCWAGDHAIVSVAVAFPSILIWCIATPSLCLWWLHINRNRLKNLDVKLMFGFLYQGYTKSHYYWEFIILYRKVIIVCLSVFLDTVSLSIQALTVLLILAISFYVQNNTKPYINDDLNQLEKRSILVSAITIFCGLYYITRELEYSYKILLFVFILLINIYFLVYWLKHMTGLGLGILYTKFRIFRWLFTVIRIHNWVKKINKTQILPQESTIRDDSNRSFMSLTKSVVKESSIVSEDIIKSEDETGNNPIYPTLNDISEEEKDSNSISFDFENSFK